MGFVMYCVAAYFGTIAFSVLFSVPKKYYLTCGFTGLVGALCYYFLMPQTSKAVASFLATLVVVFHSRFAAVHFRCPVTIFLLSGIIPLVPGAGVYWTAYYTISQEPTLALDWGMESLRIAVAIVLGIVFVFEFPQKWFLWGNRRKKED